jgi:hypothetical protein
MRVHTTALAPSHRRHDGPVQDDPSGSTPAPCGPTGATAPLAQRTHTHALPRAASGIRPSASFDTVAPKHQHSFEPAAMPHSFATPQSGQRLGSGSASLTRTTFVR